MHFKTAVFGMRIICFHRLSEAAAFDVTLYKTPEMPKISLIHGVLCAIYVNPVYSRKGI